MGTSQLPKLSVTWREHVFLLLSSQHSHATESWFYLINTPLGSMMVMMVLVLRDVKEMFAPILFILAHCVLKRKIPVSPNTQITGKAPDPFLISCSASYYKQ